MALFASMAGPALAAFAMAATERELDGHVFAYGDAGDTMLIVMSGAVITQRPNAPARRVEAGGVVGELAVLTREFTSLTPENCMKWGEIRPNNAEWRFGPADKLVELRDSGALEKIYNHLSSLVGWDRLIAIASAKQAKSGPIAANIQ